MDGFSTLKKLKEKPETSDIPVIMLAGMIDFTSDSNGDEWEGVDALLYKPFSPLELITLVTALRRDVPSGN